MAFFHVEGPALNQAFKKSASIAIANGSVLGFDGTNGYVEQAETASTRIAGVSLRKVASTDDDYASNTTIPVVVPGPEDIFEADVQSGQTAAQSYVGGQYDLSTNSDGTAQTIDLTGVVYKVVTVVGFISASKVLVKFNGNYVFANKAN